MTKKKNPELPPVVDLDTAENLNEVTLEVDKHSEKDDLLTSAARMLGGASERPNKKENDRKYRERKKNKVSANAEDFSTIIVTLMTLAIAAFNVPDDIQPDNDEMQAFSIPATRLLLRHFPLANKLSADMLDVIGMISALSAYSMRTRSAWALRTPKKTEPATIPPFVPDDPFLYPVTPIKEEPTPQNGAAVI